MEKKRSVGITAIAIVHIVLGTLPIINFFYSDWKYRQVVSEGYHSTLAGTIGMFMLLSAAVSGGFLIVLGTGLLRLKKRVRIYSMCFALFMLWILCVITAMSVRSLEGPAFNMALPLIIILYPIYIYLFSRPKVIEQFRSDKAGAIETIKENLKIDIRLMLTILIISISSGILHTLNYRSYVYADKYPLHLTKEFLVTSLGTLVTLLLVYYLVIYQIIRLIKWIDRKAKEQFNQ